MNTYARIQNGSVAELFESAADPSTLFNPTLVWEPVTTCGVAVGWVFCNGSFSAPTPVTPTPVATPSLTQLQAELASIQAQITALSSAAPATTSSANGG